MKNSGAADGRRERHRVSQNDARLLTRLLDDAVRAHDGEDVLASVARLRAATASYAASPTPRRLRRCDAVLDGVDPGVAMRIARAFTVGCHLETVAEERARVRELRTRGRGTPPALLRDIDVTEVLTAHPTEARRRSVLEHLWRIGDLLDDLDDPRAGGRGRADLLRRLADEVEGLWLTDPVRSGAPTPLDEVRAMTALFDRTIFDVVPRVVRSTGGRASFRWSSWVGGDRDGNPHVTAEVTRQTAAIGREHVLLGYERAARTIARSLSVGAADVPASSTVRRRLRALAATFPARAAELERTLPDAPHRRALGLIAEAVAATRTRSKGGYRHAEALVADLALLRSSLRAGGAERLADGDLADLETQVHAFGFHLASIEVRQHANVVRSALAEHDDEVAATFRTIADIQRDVGPHGCHRLIVSFTRSADDVAAAYELARRADPELPRNLDVVPLLESAHELEHAVEILENVVALPDVRRRLRATGDRLEVMLGYSDSAKEMGTLAASIVIWRTQRDLAAWARGRGIELTLFHGRGGALGRGGGPTARAIRAQPPGTIAARFKVTEQGEVAFARYGDADIAWHHLEQLARAVADATTEGDPDPSEPFDDDIGLLVDASRACWHDLVTTPGFARWFSTVTPIEHIATLPIASRPVSRTATVDDLDALRAIPWVFSWSQARVNLPGWFGVGAGLAAVADRPRGLATLRRMHRSWPLFAVLLENAELALAKADRTLAERAFARAPEHPAAGRIREEWTRAARLLLAVTGHDELLGGRPALRGAIDERAGAVAALTLLQLRFRDDPDARRLVQTTIGGIAAGLQNTG